jgi:hypothetical protein
MRKSKKYGNIAKVLKESTKEMKSDCGVIKICLSYDSGNEDQYLGEFEDDETYITGYKDTIQEAIDEMKKIILLPKNLKKKFVKI